MASMQTAAAAVSAYNPAQYRRLTTYEQHAADNAASGTTAPFEKGNTPSFADLIDIINPLQHIPVINTIYRAITGDHEGAMADVIGGTIYGGPIGTAAAIADLGLRDATGKDAGEHVMAWMGFDSGTKTDNATAVASAKTAAPAQPATASAATAAPAADGKPLTLAMADGSAQSGSAPVSIQAGPHLGTASAVQAGPAPQPVPTPAPVTVTAQPMAATGSSSGPAAVGDYLVFGGAGGASAATTSMNQAPAGQAKGMQNQASAAPAFATYGANAQPAPVLPTVSGPPVSVQSPTPVAQMAAATKTASAMPLQSHLFPVPPRTGPATPAQNLPPPTTGPGALPGGKSQALSAQDLAAQEQNRSFLSAYTQALEKYQNAQRLGAANGSSGPTSGVAAGGPMGGAPAAPAPTNLIQPANDVTEGNTEDNIAVTVH